MITIQFTTKNSQAFINNHFIICCCDVLSAVQAKIAGRYIPAQSAMKMLTFL